MAAALRLVRALPRLRPLGLSGNLQDTRDVLGRDHHAQRTEVLQSSRFSRRLFYATFAARHCICWTHSVGDFSRGFGYPALATERSPKLLYSASRSTHELVAENTLLFSS